MSENSLAPVIFFAYCRADQTAKSLEALLNNQLIDKSKIYVFADGPKSLASEENHNEISKVREIIKKKTAHLDVEYFFAKKNLGLTKSIMDGISKVMRKHGKAIIVEDDIVTGEYFLQYMNDCLVEYENQPEVMHIGGYTPPIKSAYSKETYFLRFAGIWGWATWQDRWERYIRSTEEIIQKLETKNEANHFDFDGKSGFYPMLHELVDGTLDTWDINWVGTVYVENGLGIYPTRSLVRNIGFDGSGVHCGAGEWYWVKNINQNKVELVKEAFVDNTEIRSAYEQFYRDIDKVSLWDKIKAKSKLELKKLKKKNK